MTKEQHKEYYDTYDSFLEGRITLKQWIRYCHNLMDTLLEENKDVLYRLKYRGE